MRKLLHTTAALSALLVTSMVANAADVRARPAPYAPPPPVYAPPPFSWTGFYLGGNIGGAWANRDVLDPVLGVNFNNGNSNGVFIGGGQLGYNWQVNYFVLGFEWDFDGAANNNNSGTVFIPRVGTIQVTSNNRWITTLAARFGVTNGPWLFYGKAGGGWVGSDDFTITNLTTGGSITGSNNSNSGWLVGVGIEWAFAPNWSAKVEYNFLGLDDRRFIAPVGFLFLTGDPFIERNRDIQMVKVGINYRFNWNGYGYRY
jgi:outer membrane immunogenic protein